MIFIISKHKNIQKPFNISWIPALMCPDAHLKHAKLFVIQEEQPV